MTVHSADCLCPGNVPIPIQPEARIELSDLSRKIIEGIQDDEPFDGWNPGIITVLGNDETTVTAYKGTPYIGGNHLQITSAPSGELSIFINLLVPTLDGSKVDRHELHLLPDQDGAFESAHTSNYANILGRLRNIDTTPLDLVGPDVFVQNIAKIADLKGIEPPKKLPLLKRLFGLENDS